ncbi:hypothetical protein Q8F55_001638 [Vanrija albida]|uniref:Protein CPL1-like domain-containing protein n=1 Tax=Vanrija albida TaxID=181172 RepID=A0ABR3Q7H6_9TREE
MRSVLLFAFALVAVQAQLPCTDGNSATPAQVDPALVQQNQPCVAGCTQTASAAVPGCDPLDRGCICGGDQASGTAQQKDFYQKAATCIIQTCGFGAITPAQQISKNTCDNGFCNVVLPSGVTRKRSLDRAQKPSCRPFQKLCKTTKGTVKNSFLVQLDEGNYDGFECVDVLHDLESCGGCPGVDGVDCTTIEGASDVSCVLGKCKVHACDEGLTLTRGLCL